MRNRTIRMKRLRAERIVDDYMRMPRRIMHGPDYRETNWDAFRNGQTWIVPLPED